MNMRMLVERPAGRSKEEVGSESCCRRLAAAAATVARLCRRRRTSWCGRPSRPIWISLRLCLCLRLRPNDEWRTRNAVTSFGRSARLCVAINRPASLAPIEFRSAASVRCLSATSRPASESAVAATPPMPSEIVRRLRAQVALVDCNKTDKRHTSRVSSPVPAVCGFARPLAKTGGGGRTRLALIKSLSTLPTRPDHTRLLAGRPASQQGSKRASLMGRHIRNERLAKLMRYVRERPAARVREHSPLAARQGFAATLIESTRAEWAGRPRNFALRRPPEKSSCPTCWPFRRLRGRFQTVARPQADRLEDLCARAAT